MGGGARHRQTGGISGFVQVGHHVLPPLPLYALGADERPATLTELPLGAAHVLGGIEVRRERCGVVRYAFDRGAVRALRLGLEADPESVGFQDRGEGRQESGLGTAGIRSSDGSGSGGGPRGVVVRGYRSSGGVVIVVFFIFIFFGVGLREIDGGHVCFFPNFDDQVVVII